MKRSCLTLKMCISEKKRPFAENIQKAENLLPQNILKRRKKFFNKWNPGLVSDNNFF